MIPWQNYSVGMCAIELNDTQRTWCGPLNLILTSCYIRNKTDFFVNILYLTAILCWDGHKMYLIKKYFIKLLTSIVYFCSPTSDGSAAAILASEEFVEKHNLKGQAVEILAQVLTTDLPSAFGDSCIKMVSVIYWMTVQIREGMVVLHIEFSN